MHHKCDSPIRSLRQAGLIISSWDINFPSYKENLLKEQNAEWAISWKSMFFALSPSIVGDICCRVRFSPPVSGFTTYVNEYRGGLLSKYNLWAKTYSGKNVRKDGASLQIPETGAQVHLRLVFRTALCYYVPVCIRTKRVLIKCFLIWLRKRLEGSGKKAQKSRRNCNI